MGLTPAQSSNIPVGYWDQKLKHTKVFSSFSAQYMYYMDDIITVSTFMNIMLASNNF